MRFAAIIPLIVLSFLPHVLVAELLGATNLIWLALIWVALLVCFSKKSNRIKTAAIIICALAMAIPSSPNYVFVSDPSGPRLVWTGFENVLSTNGIYGAIFFFLFYGAIFSFTRRLISLKPALA
jgi:hypothetical protein